jgi:hypothetical protein
MAIVVKNKTKDGKESTLIMTDFVDAKMRRTKEVVIDNTSGTVSYLVEGETTPEIIQFTETESSITYTWPDGFSATVSIIE